MMTSEKLERVLCRSSVELLEDVGWVFCSGPGETEVSRLVSELSSLRLLVGVWEWLVEGTV